MRRGTEQGSTPKFQDAKHDQVGIEEGLMEALKAWRAAISEAEVRACTRK